MSTPTTTSVASGPRIGPNTVLPQRKASVLQVAQRLPFRVLQTNRAPAQLSLFLRPGLGLR